MARPLKLPLAMSRGRRLLLALLQLTSARNVAARCRVSEPSVSEWASGRYVPSAPARERLERNYGIRIDAWDIAWQEARRGQTR